MTRRKILIICNSLCLPSVGMSGTGAIYQLVQALSQRGEWEIHILTSLPSWGEPLRGTGELTVHYLPVGNLFLLRLLFFIKAIILHRRFQYDLIHEYSSLPVLVGLTGWLGKICRCRVIHTLCTVNTSWLGSPNLGWGLSGMDRVICNDLITRNALVKRVGSERDKVSYLPLGVDTTRFKPLPRKREQSAILFIGSLEMRKGASVLAEAAKVVAQSYPEARFVFASYGKEVRDPHYGRNLARLKKELSPVSDQVEFLSGKQDISALLAEATIFVLPAVSRNGTLGQPQTLLEAMACGRASVVSDIQRGDGLVEDGVNCLLFESGNPQALAEKVIFLLSNPQVERRLGGMARRKAEREFTVTEVAGALARLYNDLL